MAKAPRPGVSRRADAVNAAQTVLRITIRGKSWDFCPNNLTITERGQVRKQTGGMAFETYWDGQTAIGLDSVIILWWLARRASGEPDLALTVAEADFLAFDNLTADDLSVEQIDDVADEELADNPE